jgi:hypothetical protein
MTAQPDGHTADLKRIASIPDPVTRAREAGALLKQCAEATKALAGVRRNAVVQMHEDGMSHQEIADAIGGMSKQRAFQLAGDGWTHTVVAKREKTLTGRAAYSSRSCSFRSSGQFVPHVPVHAQSSG